MRKRILLIGYNFYPEPTGIGKYSGEMIFWLARQGYDCTVITSYPYYPYWQVQAPYHKNKFWFKTEEIPITGHGRLKVIRCPMYVPANPSGKKRILLDISFFVAAFLKILQLLPARKFDWVINVVPSFHFGLLGVFYKKIRKSRLLYHIQDMQIEAARDLDMISSTKVIATMFKLEKYLMQQADVVSSISQGMVQKISLKAQKPVSLIPNWTDTQQFYPLENRSVIKQEFGFSAQDKIILYSGAIGEKQGLEAILYAAQALRAETELKFVICGSGPYKEKLQELAHELHLKNVVFLPLQPFSKFNQFLNLADVHLIIQKANASDLVMPSKLTTILAVGGLALITADKGSDLHTLVQENQIGLLVAAENQAALNESILAAFSNDKNNIRQNARIYAEKNLAIDKVMAYCEELFSVATN